MHITIKGNRGFSLIEVMTSMLLGLIVLLMVVQLFVNAKNNHAQNDRMSETLESGRYALRQLATDLKGAGFLGGVLETGAAGISIDPSLVSPTTDCGSTSEVDWAYDLATYRAVQFKANNTPTTANADHTCIAAADFKGGTDLLVVKRVYNQPIDPTAVPTQLTQNKVYLRSNYSTACLWYYDGSSVNPAGGSCPTTGIEDWQYMVHAYYIRPYSKPNEVVKVPTLCRKSLDGVGGQPTMTELCLAEGIEDFHIMFGIDTDTPMDGIANVFESKPAAADLKTRAVSARIFVLARAKQEDSTFTNSKTYTMGDKVAGPFNDKYYRRLYSTTVLLRNPMYAAIFDQ